MKKLKALLAILQGEAVVITKKGENTADVLVGENCTKQFVISSMVGALKKATLIL